MRLLLARHGESLWNAERRFQGATDIALSDRGRAQAEALARGLRGYRVRAAYVSPYRRAVETAELALRGTGLPLVIDEELRELSLGEWRAARSRRSARATAIPTWRGSARRTTVRHRVASRCRS